MSPRVPGRDSPVWVLVGTGVAGVATYVLLVAVGRALGTVRYGDFSIFWTFVVVVSIGAFLPVEQLVARQVARGAQTVRRLLTAGVRAAGVVGAVVLALVAVGVALRPATGALTTACSVVVVAAFAVQFAGRGVLAGRRDLRGYAVVLAVDTLGRALAAAVLAAAGVRSVGPYLVAVTASCAASAVTAWFLARRSCEVVAAPAGPQHGGRGLGRDLVWLVVAGTCMQLLFNSPVPAAAAADAFPGVLLAVLSIVRVPVFVFQGAQAGYVARIAGLALRGPAAELRRLLLVVGGAAVAVGAATVAGAVLVGPWAVRTAFGPEYDVTRTLVVLAAAGVACYLCAAVLNDVAVALGAHRAIAVAWPLAVAVGVTSYLLASDPLRAVTLPLTLGGATAALVLGPVVLARVRHAPRPVTQREKHRA
ncbi:hypothetical protein Cfla_2375 [Cellulomonas flavigena DSM 20109]|uniref:Polysaccharide biosynthesis protein n=1 Tax=Cellulomonas flavigena (strain ATCC 482 / DSM 20109 / BCRC 11376 / JCM 18109 / NBRC 3775 / NCIMB 8073 / NRS 134) TaxID=446466 RepID=D5UHE4_CELFN|nr:hypothetical protein [Cellulomonas flavigena]ADG75265.1 hypothetical protein Cfla_2375 [Cellulomonas flavigena DSM 20109]